MNNEEIQFSIYKISKSQLYSELEGLNDKLTANQLLDKLLFYLECYINKSNGRDKVKKNKIEDYVVLLIKSKREPIWKNLIISLMELDEETEKDFAVFNASTSYLIFKIIEDEIYVMTGGRGSNYVSKFIEKNFGLYLLPKIIDKNNPVLKKIVENNTSGNNLTTRRVIKNATSILAEDKMGSIYKELSIQVSNELASKFGIDLEESKKMIGISSGDSFIIKKSIDLKTLEFVLITLSDLSKKEDNFILNYFVSAEKKRKKKSDLDNLLYEKIKSGESNLFEIIADDIDEFYFSSNRYILKNKGEIIFQKETPITMSDIVDYINYKTKNNPSLTFIKNFFTQTTISTIDSDGIIVIYDTKLYELIRGNMEFEKESYYILNGSWYVFEDSYFEMLNNQYIEICTTLEKRRRLENIEEEFQILKNESSEDKYNNSFIDNNKIIVAHKSQIKNVEIADLIFWNDNSLYLMCNKNVFNGAGVRDLENQMYTSSAIVSHSIDTDFKIFENYYDKLRITEQAKISKQDFVNLFKTKKIVYIAGFCEPLKIDTRSVYCQYLIREIYQNMSSYNFDFLVVNYSSD